MLTRLRERLSYEFFNDYKFIISVGANFLL